MSGYLIESEEMIYNILVFIKEQRLPETKYDNMNLNGNYCLKVMLWHNLLLNDIQ